MKSPRTFLIDSDIIFEISRGCWGVFRERLVMHGGGEQAHEATSVAPEDDMKEGDLGDGLGRKPGGLEAPKPLPHTGLLKRAGGNGSVAFSWKSCRALYSSFHQELEAGRPHTSWRLSGAESLSDLSCEELRQRLQEVSEEVELLRCELEATQRHLEGKHEALKILQGRAMFDKATTHTKTLLQKSEERNKALEKVTGQPSCAAELWELSAMQWEITFNQVQFKNLERSWKEKYDRMCSENKALSDSVEDRLRELQELKSQNASLSQQCLELVSMLSVQEKKAFQGSLPPHSTLARDTTALELAVLGACHCSSASVRSQCPCSCARTAAASRKQVLQLKQELEVQRRRKEEALTMADAFRIAFEQQLKRKSDHVMRFAEAEGYLRKDTPPTRREEVKGRSVSRAQKLKGMLQSCAEVKMSDDPAEMLRNLLDLLNDKEEALAHQRKVSYMLARHSEDLESRLLQLRGQECEESGRGTEREGWDSRGSGRPFPKHSGAQGNISAGLGSCCPKPSETPGSLSTDSPAAKPSETQRSASFDLDRPSPKPSVIQRSASFDLNRTSPKPPETQRSASIGLDSPSPKHSETEVRPSIDVDRPAPERSETHGGSIEYLDTLVHRLITVKSSRETPLAVASQGDGGFGDGEQQKAEEEEQRREPG
ncbi:coiled-coil domain-containing protein 125 isoform X2 [Conger conger]|uniref:coiled-coil domain-containing protein 125 isoform X2 n=1 Tax=Conger conger TaxID=82655 RepID=UPI002A5A1AFD|nr:coiled-coil domain-containing protein 125 isoform X2 [Conger conger]